MVRLDDTQNCEYIRIPNSQKPTVNDKHINLMRYTGVFFHYPSLCDDPRAGEDLVQLASWQDSDTSTQRTLGSRLRVNDNGNSENAGMTRKITIIRL